MDTSCEKSQTLTALIPSRPKIRILVQMDLPHLQFKCVLVIILIFTITGSYKKSFGLNTCVIILNFIAICYIPLMLMPISHDDCFKQNTLCTSLWIFGLINWILAFIFFIYSSIFNCRFKRYNSSNMELKQDLELSN